MDGRALTASELAHVAGTAPQTASGIARITTVGLLTVEKQVAVILPSPRDGGRGQHAGKYHAGCVRAVAGAKRTGGWVAGRGVDEKPALAAVTTGRWGRRRRGSTHCGRRAT